MRIRSDRKKDFRDDYNPKKKQTNLWHSSNGGKNKNSRMRDRDVNKKLHTETFRTRFDPRITAR